MPKSDVRVVLLVAALLISWFLHTIQKQKYEKVVKFLHNATLNNLGLKNGGTKQTMELFRRASDLYDAQIKECINLKQICYVYSIIYSKR